MSSKKEECCKKILNKYLEEPNKSQVQLAKELKIPRSTVSNVLRSYKQRFSIEKKNGIGKKSGFQDKALVKKIKDARKENPNLSERALAIKIGTTKSS